MLSRWKMMAGVLGVSIGGLAAAASQCQKFDRSTSRSDEAPLARAEPKLPPASAPAAPPKLELPPVPAAPQLTPAGVTQPAQVEILPVPVPAKVPTVKPEMQAPVLPTTGTTLILPEQTVVKPAVPAGIYPSDAPAVPDLSPPVKPTPMPVPVAVTPPTELVPPPPMKPAVSPTVASELPPPPLPERGMNMPVASPVSESPYRILLRVGEGEPTFEVKNGDNLVLKVACEKVDIKSPERGAGPSEVTARGKVRFAGFGAEGTCDELKFYAGTGEVSMSGSVKVQVKDKLGRVESELSTGSMKYKIDSSAVGGQIKP